MEKSSKRKKKNNEKNNPVFNNIFSLLLTSAKISPKDLCEKHYFICTYISVEEVEKKIKYAISTRIENKKIIPEEFLSENKIANWRSRGAPPSPQQFEYICFCLEKIFAQSFFDEHAFLESAKIILEEFEIKYDNDLNNWEDVLRLSYQLTKKIQ